MLALAAAGCAGDSGLLDPGNTALDDTALDDTALDDTALDDTALDDTASDDTAPGSTAPDDTADDPATEHIVEETCFGDDEDRCGHLLVPQSATGATTVSLSFRVVGEARSGVPVLVLAGRGVPDSVDGLDLTDRPLIELSPRGHWPSEPVLSCPEFSWLGPDPDAAEWGRVTQHCARRLTDAGVELLAHDSAARGRDIDAALSLLGFDQVDVVAPGTWATDLAHADLGDRLRRVIYVRPELPTGDPIAEWAGDLRATLDASWALCEAAPDCRTHGTVGEFLDAIDALQADPIVLTAGPQSETGAGRQLDSVWLLDLILADLTDPGAAGYLPELHRAVRDRDVATLDAYVFASGGSVATGHMTTRCASVSGVEPSAPPDLRVLARWVAETREFLAAFCDGWSPGIAAADPVEPGPGLTVVPEGVVNTTTARMAELGPVLTANAVGAPPAACIAAAARDWFDHERVTDDPSCTTPAPITRRDTRFELVADRYEYRVGADKTTLWTVVPDTWDPSGHGSWFRNADPLDVTNLDVYVLPEQTVTAAEDWFVDGWEIVDPIGGSLTVDGLEWRTIEGPDAFATPGTVFFAAFAVVQDLTVAFLFQADAVELPSLLEEVVEPALAAARIER